MGVAPICDDIDPTEDGSTVTATAICDASVKPAKPAIAGTTMMSQFPPFSSFRFNWVLTDFLAFDTKASVEGAQEIANTAAIQIFILLVPIFSFQGM